MELTRESYLSALDKLDIIICEAHQSVRYRRAEREKMEPTLSKAITSALEEDFMQWRRKQQSGLGWWLNIKEVTKPKSIRDEYSQWIQQLNTSGIWAFEFLNVTVRNKLGYVTYDTLLNIGARPTNYEFSYLPHLSSADMFAMLCKHNVFDALNREGFADAGDDKFSSETLLKDKSTVVSLRAVARCLTDTATIKPCSEFISLFLRHKLEATDVQLPSV